MSNHPIVHIEFSSKDMAATGKYYSDLFGWKVEQMPEYNYAIFSAEGGPGGGFNPISETNPAGTIIVYVGTDDIEASLVKAASLGGKIVMHKTEIPGQGWFGVFLDPDGNTVALYTALRPSQ
jgi:predicted enzyme related to lactoylglutathione lyase